MKIFSYAMLGSSGCGKTTLMTCLVGINQLDSGEMEVFSEPVTKANKSRVGYMPQESALIGGFTVREMIWFFGTIYGMDSGDIDERFRFLSKLLELPEGDKMVKDCSGGQQRRISFAVSLVHEPEVLILDEPTVGVDPLLRNRIWEYLIEIVRSRNVTVLLSTHYIEEARQSSCVGLLRNGVLIAEDSPKNIMRKTESRSLEEAFLKLSERQEIDFVKHVIPIAFRYAPPKLRKSSEGSSSTSLQLSEAPHKKPILKQTSYRIILALVTKHLLEITRNFGFVALALVTLHHK